MGGPRRGLRGRWRGHVGRVRASVCGCESAAEIAAGAVITHNGRWLGMGMGDCGVDFSCLKGGAAIDR